MSSRAYFRVGAWIIGGLFCAGGVAGQDGVPALRKALVLNEVLFDELGEDAVSEGEFVELFAAVDLNLDGFRLRDVADTWSVDLPDRQVGAGAYVVVFLGSHVPPGMVGDRTDAQSFIALAAGLPPGDHLSKAGGGIVLERMGAHLDEVSWGTAGVPPGADLATFVDISFAGRAMRPGDSLGRSRDSSFTRTAADWSSRGGRNSAYPTAGLRNVLPRAGAADLNLWAQGFLNQVFVGMSLETLQPGWLQVADASVSDVTVDAGASWTEVGATHSLTVLVDGVPVAFAGKLVARSERATSDEAVRRRLTLQGTLVGPDSYALSVNHEEEASGFHTSLVTIPFLTQCVWEEGGAAYPYEVAGTLASMQTGVGEFVQTDVRDALDWGGAGSKHSETRIEASELEDGTFRSAARINRPLEMGPPSLAGAGGQRITAQTTVLVDAEWTLRPEVSTSRITRFDVLLDGQGFVELAPGAVGSLSERQTNQGETATLNAELSLPLVRAGHAIEFGSVLHAEGFVDAGKHVVRGEASVLVDGVAVGVRAFHMDPPAVDSDEGRSLGGAVGAVATCGAAGALAGAGVGAAGGALAGGIAGGVTGSAAGGVGALPGAAVGAKTGLEVGALAGSAVGGLFGAIGCGIAYFTPWWD